MGDVATVCLKDIYLSWKKDIYHLVIAIYLNGKYSNLVLLFWTVKSQANNSYHCNIITKEQIRQYYKYQSKKK